MKIDGENIDFLLKNVRTLLPNGESNHGYNVFSVLEVDDKEVIMCRMLADLLNPCGQHGVGDIFLRSFLKDVLHVDESVIENIGSLQVTKEYPIDIQYSGPNESERNEHISDEKRQPKRIDIVIHGARHFIPIEVKIDATETGTQCWEYYQYALKHDCHTNLYFLTKHGTLPNNSYDTFVLEKCQGRCKLISFEHDISKWLGDISKIDFNDANGIIHNTIRQYLDSVMYITDARRITMVEQCAEKIMEVDIEAGIAIAKSFTAIQDRLITKLFIAIEKSFPKELGIELNKESENYWGKINKEFFGDVFGKGQKYISKKPCTCFKIKVEDDSFPREQMLYVHVDWRIWAELRNGDKISWIYLPVGNRNEPKDDEKSDIPNFYTMNPAALKLNDSRAMESFIECSIKSIKDKLLK